MAKEELLIAQNIWPYVDIAKMSGHDYTHHALEGAPAHHACISDEQGLSWIVFDSTKIPTDQVLKVADQNSTSDPDDYEGPWPAIETAIRDAGAWIKGS
jgi:hypothetical protein